MQAVTLSLADKNHKLYGYLNDLGIPGNKTEQYKNFAIKPVLSKTYKLQTATAIDAIEGSKLVINNGVVSEYPKGIKVTIENNLHADTSHYDALYYLSHIISPLVISIELQENAQFEIEHLFDKEETLLSYRIFIKTASNSQVEVFETFQTQGSKQSFLLYGVDADIAPDSTLRWIRNENASTKDTVVVGSHHYDVKKQGAFELKTFDFGSGKALHIYKIDLSDYAWADAQHLLLVTKEAHRGNVVAINHNKPYAKSVQEARSILKDKATAIFDGKILVAHDAKYSNAKQNSKAILLGEHAHMYAKPQLEIYTDELEASHGSTIGQLEEDLLFYLRSRGISLEESRKMLVLAFADTLIDGVKNSHALKTIHQDFNKAYYV
ncbi:MAG: SufD family Fe-S cluster assembly protein [Sulfurimonas sp.]